MRKSLDWGDVNVFVAFISKPKLKLESVHSSEKTKLTTAN